MTADRRGGTADEETGRRPLALAPGDRDLAEAVVWTVAAAVGADLVAAYLYGSATLGGLRPDSDVDVLAIVTRRLTGEERLAIVSGLLDVSGRRARRGVPARPVELTVVALPEIRPWRYPPAMELLYGEWLRDAFECGEIEDPRPNPDLATVLEMVRLYGRALLGPPPGDVLGPVPPADLRRGLVDPIPSLLADLEPDTRNVLLTLARIWTTLATGEIRSKDGAADWALPRLPETDRPLLALARAQYIGEAARLESPAAGDAWLEQMPEARALADAMVSEISRLA